MMDQEVLLNDLPKWSRWPERLLGLEPWTMPRRTPEKVSEEYNLDKYAKCLRFCLESGALPSPEDVKRLEIGLSNAPLCVSIGDTLVVMPADEVRRRHYSLPSEIMEATIKQAEGVVELGCGYGYNLWNLRTQFPEKIYVGGDFSENAVQIANLLFKVHPNITVKRFDFHEQTYDILDELENVAPAVVFTCHAIEQLASASHTIQVLSTYKDRIKRVVHFEPVYELYGESLLGHMRRRYAQVNDYNQDLLTILKRRSDVRILQVKAEVFGANPFNPTSVIEWEFR